MILFEKIRWKNFLSTGNQYTEISLTDNNTNLIIGTNGAGKSTLMRAICGLYDCEGFSKSCEERRTQIGYMPEQVRWEGRVSVRHALESIAMMRDSEVDIDGIIQTVGLKSKSEHILDNLSQGMRQRLSLACALIGNPRILVMDEPLNGLDPLAQRAFSNLLENLAKKGVAIVISSHQVSDLEALVDNVALLHRGQLLIEGSLNEVRKNLGLEDDSGIVEMICSVTGILVFSLIFVIKTIIIGDLIGKFSNLVNLSSSCSPFLLAAFLKAKPNFSLPLPFISMNLHGRNLP